MTDSVFALLSSNSGHSSLQLTAVGSRTVIAEFVHSWYDPRTERHSDSRSTFDNLEFDFLDLRCLSKALSVFLDRSLDEMKLAPLAGSFVLTGSNRAALDFFTDRDGPLLQITFSPPKRHASTIRVCVCVEVQTFDFKSSIRLTTDVSCLSIFLDGIRDILGTEVSA